MKPYIEKFISIETEKKEKLEQELEELAIEEICENIDLSLDIKIIESTIVITKNFIRLYSYDPKTWNQLSEVFIDFNILSNELTSCNELSYKEKTNILFYMISKNLATKILKGNISVIDSRNIMKHKFKTITKNELRSMIINSGFRRYFEADINLLTEKEKEQRKELEEYLHEHSLNIADIVKQHNVIQQHYFDKLDKYTKEDIEIIIETLKKLKVTEEMSNIILKVLTSKLEKQQKQKKEYIPVEKEIKEKKRNLSTNYNKNY